MTEVLFFETLRLTIDDVLSCPVRAFVLVLEDDPKCVELVRACVPERPASLAG